jgi:hypothetical protein
MDYEELFLERLEALRLYLNGKYQTLAKENAIIEGGRDDPDLAAAVASLAQHLLSPSGAYRAINNGRHTKASS